MDEKLSVDSVPGTFYRICQDKSLFCYGIDAVLLSAWADVVDGSRVIDLGTGNGIIPLGLYGRHQNLKVTGLEFQEKCAALAERNVELNGLEKSIDIVQGDIRNVAQIFEAGSFDCVVSNPPYFPIDSGTASPNKAKDIARREVQCTLDDVVAAAAHLVRDSGIFCMIHRSSRLEEILPAVERHGFCVRRICHVRPDEVSPANLVLLDCIRGNWEGEKKEAFLTVYERPGVYADEVCRMYGRNSC